MRASYLPKVKVIRKSYFGKIILSEVTSITYKKGKICRNDLAFSLLNVFRENSLFNARQRIENDITHITCQSSSSDFTYVFFVTPHL